MIERAQLSTRISRTQVTWERRPIVGFFLLFVLALVGTAAFAKGNEGANASGLESMPMAAPPIHRGEASTSAAAPFSLNASKTQENTTIPRPSFNLNASKFTQGVEQTDPQLQPGSPKFDVSAFKQAPLAGNVQTSGPLTGGVQALKLLANYDIELIVDESLSMRRTDCPGGLSRWNWCGMQAGQLAKQLAPYVRNGFTLTTFAGGYEVYEKSSPEHVMQLFQSPMFTFGTRMSLPLDDRLNNYFNKKQSSGRPLLIAVITDGVPAPRREPFLVADVLINATKRMRDPRDVTVVFFQIGGADFKGQRFLSYLDNGLMADGARFDIVKNVPMERLAQIGLAQSLVNSIQEFAAQNKLAPSVR
ncbi:MAG TPA: hypothetical protein EYN91_09465 [Candidatus Melainabacteria bacterium]|nr:hypothetical protein [Candidatus Melainabacteria bacterium]HIN67170.1 hypothetical protein [Candidatus Obscuribacterales bacterium]